MPARDDHIPRLRGEPVAASLARLEEVVAGMREDVSEIKAGQETFVKAFDHRVSYLEDIRVKALEDREIRRDAIADERKRAADQAAQHAQSAAQSASASAAEAQTRQLKITWKLATLVGLAMVLAMVLAPILSDLIGRL